MQSRTEELTRKRRKNSFLRNTGRMLMALGRELVRVLSRDAVVVVSHLRLFLGMLLALIGLLSFASDLYCDGNVSSYYACTRPSTYYYYPWWATLLIVLGVTLVVIWFLRQRTVRV